jgi:transposase
MQPKNVNSESIISFLCALHKEMPGRIVLLWDGYSSHKSKLVKEHIAAQKDWLTVEKFPAYAPELNPVEYLHSALKTKDVRGFCADHVAEIADRLELAAERIGNNEQIMRGFLKASSLFDLDDNLCLHDSKTLAA